MGDRQDQERGERMTLFEQPHLVDLIAILMGSVTTGVLAGCLWSLIFKIKTKPGE